MNSDFKSISAKISRDEYSLILEYCKKKGISPSRLIRDLLLTEIKAPLPNNAAGENKITYNKDNDFYSWTIILDTGKELEIIKNLSPEYINQLQKVIIKAINERNTNINKKQEKSVPIPDNIVRRGK